MTDQIPAGPVRAWVTAWETTRPEHRTLADAEGLVQALREMLPTLPTLADMAAAERAACRRMQCDVKGEDGSATIYAPNWKNGSATILWPSGFIEQTDWENVTPRPDLPRMT